MPAITQFALVRALVKRGYLDSIGPSGRTQWSAKGVASDQDAAVSAALLDLQRTYGLAETGDLSPETEAFLLTPHCSVPDRRGPPSLRAEGGVPWPKRSLSYEFATWPDTFTEAAVRTVIWQAFEVWSTVVALVFTEVQSNGDIRIVFGAGNHGDDWPFEGPGGEYAHAFYPDWPGAIKGDIHFDLDESWSIAAVPPQGSVDLLAVAVHEIGHALGLPHAPTKQSVMYANYEGANRTLFPRDISEIGQLYP